MTIALIIVSVCFTLLMLWQMVLPFTKNVQEQLRFDLLEDELRQVEELTGRKHLLRDNLREIDIDRELDKLTERDYLDLKRRYEHESIRIMRKLDELHGGRGWEARVERALDARALTTGAPKKKKKAKKKLTKPTATPAGAPVPCHECGKVMEPDAQFCSKCGATLAAMVTPAPSERPQQESQAS